MIISVKAHSEFSKPSIKEKKFSAVIEESVEEISSPTMPLTHIPKLRPVVEMPKFNLLNKN